MIELVLPERSVDRVVESRGQPVGFQNSATAADQRFSSRGLVLVDQAAANRSTSDPAVDRSPRSMTRLRACWVVQDPSGCPVTPRTCR
jgi:hypothetical protein